MILTPSLLMLSIQENVNYLSSILSLFGEPARRTCPRLTTLVKTSKTKAGGGAGRGYTKLLKLLTFSSGYYMQSSVTQVCPPRDSYREDLNLKPIN